MREIEAALAVWREAERNLAEADGRPEDDLVGDVERARAEYQRLAGEHGARRLRPDRSAAISMLPCEDTAIAEELSTEAAVVQPRSGRPRLSPLASSRDDETTRPAKTHNPARRR